MAPIADLIWQYKHGKITLEELLQQVPTLQWGVRCEEADGEVWWDGDNTVSDVDLFWYAEIITDDEREEILAAIP